MYYDEQSTLWCVAVGTDVNNVPFGSIVPGIVDKHVLQYWLAYVEC